MVVVVKVAFIEMLGGVVVFRPFKVHLKSIWVHVKCWLTERARMPICMQTYCPLSASLSVRPSVCQLRAPHATFN